MEIYPVYDTVCDNGDNKSFVTSCNAPSYPAVNKENDLGVN